MNARLQSVVFLVAASVLLNACGGGGGGSAPAAGTLPSTGSTPRAARYPRGSASSTFALTLQQYAPVRALFDSKSGYIDAYYDDGLHAGVEYVFRISN